MLYHDHAQSLYVEHKLPKCTSCSGTLTCSAKTPKQIYLSTAGKGLSQICNVTRALLSEANDKWWFEALPHMWK